MHLDAHMALASAWRTYYIAPLHNHFGVLLFFHIFSHWWNHRYTSIYSSSAYFAKILFTLCSRRQILFVRHKLIFELFCIFNDLLKLLLQFNLVLVMAFLLLTQLFVVLQLYLFEFSQQLFL